MVAATIISGLVALLAGFVVAFFGLEFDLWASVLIGFLCGALVSALVVVALLFTAVRNRNGEKSRHFEESVSPKKASLRPPG